MLPTATALVERLRPALVVRESCEYASAVAARRAGIPFATIAISLARIEHDVLAMVAPVVDGFADGSAEAIARAPLLTALPEALDPSPWSTTVRYRAAPGTPGSLPPWEGAGAGPLIYATFGSVVGHTGLAARVFRGALDALGSLPVRALLTVGRAIDPSSLGPVPPNVRVERWVPQAVVLAACDVVVCHGGSGTTYGALAAGVPVIVCPLYADNARNGAAVARAGAGLLVAPPDAAASWATSACELGPSLRGAIHRGLDDPTLRVAAGEIRREMGSYPLVDEALAPLGPSSPRR
jgi:UDP:flavonoid glycosyltransferase YjiC (YdhE family)